MPGRAKTIQRFMDSEYARTRWPDRSERRKHAQAFADAEVELDANKGFYVDLGAYTFDTKESKPTWIHAITVGKYDHPFYENIEFDEQRIERFEASVTQKYTGIDPDIDYEHKNGAKGGAAAGWVRDARSVLTDQDIEAMKQVAEIEFADSSDPRGLWVLVDWTPPARQALANNEYRYFSPELAEEWTHPKTGTKFQDVFMGGGITNRPFLKDLTPLNFDEALAEWEKDRDVEEEDGVKLEDILALLSLTREEACAALSLSTDASDDAIIGAAKTRLLTAPSEPPEPDPVPQEFAAQHPEVAKRLQQLEEENAANRAALLEADTQVKLSEWFEGHLKSDNGNVVRRALPPVVLDSVKDFRMKLSADLRSTFDTFMSSIVRTGTVSLDVVGGNLDPEAATSSPGERMMSKVTELQEAAKKEGKTLSFADGVRQVTKSDPDLAREWRDHNRKASGE